jgi:hypothetical protein
LTSAIKLFICFLLIALIVIACWCLLYL